MLKNNEPICMGCKKSPSEIQEYIDMVIAGEAASPEQYVREEEGTYNPANGHFLCTACYIDAGMPSSSRGWVCP